MTCIRGVIASIVWNPHTHWPTYTVELLACPAPSRRRRRRLARPLANHVFEKLSIFSTDNVRSLVHWLCFFCYFYSQTYLLFLLFVSFLLQCSSLRSLTHFVLLSLTPALSLSLFVLPGNLLHVQVVLVSFSVCSLFRFRFRLGFTRQRTITNNQLDNSLLDTPRNATPTLTRRHAYSMLPISICWVIWEFFQLCEQTFTNTSTKANTNTMKTITRVKIKE